MSKNTDVKIACLLETHSTWLQSAGNYYSNELSFISFVASSVLKSFFFKTFQTKENKLLSKRKAI